MYNGGVVACVKKVAESFAVPKILRTFAAELVKSAQEHYELPNIHQDTRGGQA